MQLKILAVLAALVAFGVADLGDIEFDDINPSCRSECTNTVRLTSFCDDAYGSNTDRTMMTQCLCSTQDATATLTACAACVRSFPGSDGSDFSGMSRTADLATLALQPMGIGLTRAGNQVFNKH